MSMILGKLPPPDLVDSVWSVSRAWRKAVLALSPALWRRVVVDVRPHDPAPALRLLRRAPSVGILKVHRLNDHAAGQWPAVPSKVLTALEKKGSAKVRCVPFLDCEEGPRDFAERLLKAVSSHLEELKIREPGGNELRCLGEMSRLSSLRLEFSHEEGAADAVIATAALPPKLEELRLGGWAEKAATLRAVQRLAHLRRLDLYYKGEEFEFDVPLPRGHCGLEALEVTIGMVARNESTLTSLLRAHADTLRQLRVWCGAKRMPAPPSVRSEATLAALVTMLRRCELSALRRVVLRRDDLTHCSEACECQLERIRAALPPRLRHPDWEVAVLCDQCDEDAVV